MAFENIEAELEKLSEWEEYTLSEIIYFDRRRRKNVGEDDYLFEMVSMWAGDIYTKDEIEERLQTLAESSVLQKVGVEVKKNSDETLKILIRFVERRWPIRAKRARFRCINIGLLEVPRCEKDEPFVISREDAKPTIKMARPCMLPRRIRNKIAAMLKDQKGFVCSRMLLRIRDCVESWYHLEGGYIGAYVAEFAISSSKEIVCMVVEGDITGLDINVINGDPNLGVLVRRELPKKMGVGHVYNMESEYQARLNLFSLGLFSDITMITLADEKNEGGTVVEIRLTVLDQEHAPSFNPRWWNRLL